MKSVFILTLIGFFSALLLYETHKITEKPAIKALEKVKVEALKQIFPFDFSDEDINTVNKAGKKFFEIRGKDKELKGIAVEVSGDKGYGGKIEILLAVSDKGKVFDYKVLSHHETPGLGNKITDSSFKKQFKGKGLKDFKWKVKKDGGSVDAITAATISSRAITGILKKGLKLVSDEYFGGDKK